MKYLVAAALYALVSLSALAQPNDLIINGVGTAQLSWTLPTSNTDGSPLPAADIANVGVFYGQSRFSSGTTLRNGCAAAPTSLSSTLCYAGARTIGGTQVGTQIELELSQAQTVAFAVAVLDVRGKISAYSNEATKTFRLVLESPPNAPVLNSVNVSMTCSTNYPEVTCSLTVE